MMNFSAEEIGKYFMAIATVKLCKNIVYRHLLCHGDERQRKNKIESIKTLKSLKISSKVDKNTHF